MSNSRPFSACLIQSSLCHRQYPVDIKQRIRERTSAFLDEPDDTVSLIFWARLTR